MMVPYYSLDSAAPLPTVFDLAGWSVAKYIIAVGAVCALSARYNFLTSTFPSHQVTALGFCNILVHNSLRCV